ncbi:MAG: glycosyltransferase family 4 protein [Parcubacteria group bacterium]|nr:glycosyltransferase family 4 protein [Parcubacteria group bacterium]
MQKKKILYVITKSNFGGAQRYVFDLATSLPKEQFSVSVLLGGEGTLKEKLYSGGIRTITLPYFKRDIHIFNDIRTFFALISILKKERPDIIHLNSSKAGILGTIAGRIADVPRIIFTSHGWAFNEQRPFWQKIFFFLIHAKTVLFSYVAIAVSEKTKGQIITRMPFLKKKIRVIYNGIKRVNLKTREESRNFLSSKNNILTQKKNSLWIGTIAELHPTKGIIYAIEAIKEIISETPHIIYIIMGDGEQREELEETIQTLGLQNNIFLLGFVPDASQYLSAFDMFLVPSISEALSYAVLEAGNAKLPVVATRVGGIPEIIENKKNGLLIPSRNAHAISLSLSYIIKNKKKRSLYGEKLFNTIKNKFSFAQMLQKTIEIYK